MVLLSGTPTDLDALEHYDLGCALSRTENSLALTGDALFRLLDDGSRREARRGRHRQIARRLFSAIPCEGGTRVFLFDLHTDGIEFYVDNSHVAQHIYGSALIPVAIRARMGDGGYVLGATDASRAK